MYWYCFVDILFIVAIRYLLSYISHASRRLSKVPNSYTVQYHYKVTETDKFEWCNVHLHFKKVTNSIETEVNINCYNHLVCDNTSKPAICMQLHSYKPFVSE